MRRLLYIIVLLAGVAQAQVGGGALEPWLTRWYDVGDQVDLSWSDCNPEGSVYWEVEILLYPSRTTVAAVTGLEVMTWAWTPTAPGHYIARARSVFKDTGEPSVWVESHLQTTNDQLCAAAENDWLIYAEIPPPTDGGLE